jgi:DNA-binding CsgD family transcriptional regulator/tetratricopeptide (TPR) repeat protein
LDNNLIFESKQPDGEMRLMMLETIREYGQECIIRSNEAKMTQYAHAEYYLALAEEAEPRLFSSDQLQWLERLEQEFDNLRAAVHYLFEQEQYGLILRLAGALWFFWLLRAHLKEGQQWLEMALSVKCDVPAILRAKALYAVATTLYFQGQWERARVLCEDGLCLYRQAGDKRGIATILNRLGHLAFREGHICAVKSLCKESLPLLEEVQDRRGIAEVLFLFSYGWYAQGEYAQARAACEKSLAIVREIGDCWAIAYVQQNLGYFAYQQGDYALARAHYKESLETCRVLRERWISASSLAGLGEVAAAQGQFTWAAQLWGATEAFCETLGTSLVPIDRAAYESAVATTSMHLGKEAFTTLWTEGRRMSLDQILADQTSTLPPRPACTAQPSITVSPPASGTGLTPREMDVLRLLTQGLTSAQIAKQLVISIVTVNFHVRSIYSKLGVSSRSAATRYAIEHHLV